MEYIIQRALQRPSLKGLWDESAWQKVPAMAINHFLSMSKSRHPRVEAKVVYQDEGLFVFFRVFDKFIRCVRTEYQSSVSQDSCVEFFVQPRPGCGYFNFEINGGGTMLLHFCQPPTSSSANAPKAPTGKDISVRKLVYDPVPWELGRQVVIYHSLPPVVEPEIEVDTEWRIEYFVPFKIFEHYLGPLGKISGQAWRANFYKCGDETSHPHWASWAPMGPECNFHLPQYFASIKFGP